MSTKIPAPRTDAVLHNVLTWEKGPQANSPLKGVNMDWVVVEADFARTLERELAQYKAVAGELAERLQSIQSCDCWKWKAGDRCATCIALNNYTKLNS